MLLLTRTASCVFVQAYLRPPHNDLAEERLLYVHVLVPAAAHTARLAMEVASSFSRHPRSHATLILMQTLSLTCQGRAWPDTRRDTSSLRHAQRTA